MDFLVTYNAQEGVFWDGSTSKQFSYSGNTYISTIVEKFNDNNPTREGYTFNGWWTYPDDQYGIGEHGLNLAKWGHYTLDTLQNGTNEITIYAHWENNTFHTITFDGNGGTPSVSSITTNKLAITLPDASLTGHTLVGWYLDKYYVNGAGRAGTIYTTPEDKTLYAYWSANIHTITFDSNNGSPISSHLETYGRAITAPANPTKEGYLFNGWSPQIPETMPDEDITFTAQWTINRYTVTWDGNGGTPSRSSDTLNFNSQISSLPTATRTGYTFQGWFTNANGGVQISEPITVGGTTTYYAKWNVITYSISYNMNGHGSVPSNALKSYTIESGTYTPPTPASVSGYTFMGWTPASIPSNSTGNKTFNANWKAEEIVPTPDAPTPEQEPTPTPTPTPDEPLRQKPYLAICCVAEHGSENIQDWISHHLDIGFDRVYIYNDGTMDGFKQMLEDYPERYNADKVEIVDFPYNHEKEYTVAAYAHFFRTHRSEYDWMAFIEPGEFIVLTKADSIKQVLANKEYRKFECVRLNVVEFSDYLQMTRDFGFKSDSVIEGTQVKSTRKMAKSIVNCKAKGLLMGMYTPTRNGEALNQCLPDLKPVYDNADNQTKKGTTVNRIDVSTMYVTPNQMEFRWRKWKRAKGY